MGLLTSRGREGAYLQGEGQERGPTSNGDGRVRREERGDGKAGAQSRLVGVEFNAPLDTV